MAASFKTFDEIKRFLIETFKDYETHLITGTNVSSLVDKMFVLSSEFCDAYRRGVLFKGMIQGRGGINVASAFQERYPYVNADVWASYISYSDQRNGKWAVGYRKVILRGSSDRTTRNEPYEAHYDRNTLVSSDTIHEAIVQALVSSLYAISVTPHVVDTYATYACNSSNPSSFSILEKASLSLYDVFASPDRDLTYKVFTIQNLVSWTFQVGWTFYGLKKYYNIVHEDLHLGNVLLVDMNDESNMFLYGAKEMMGVKWLKYVLPSGNSVVIPRGRWVMKVADFGFSECSIPMGAGSTDLVLRNKHDFFGASGTRRHTEYHPTLELSYFSLTLAVALARLVEVENLTLLKPVLDAYGDFMKSIDPSLDYKSLRWWVYPQYVELKDQLFYPDGEPKTRRGENLRIIRQRTWGPKNKPIEWGIERMFEVIPGVHGLEGYTDAANRFLVLGTEDFPLLPITSLEVVTSTAPDSIDTYVSRYLASEYDYNAACKRLPASKAVRMYLAGKDVSTLCTESKRALITGDLGNYFSDPLTSTTVKRGSLLMDASGDLAHVGMGVVWHRYLVSPYVAQVTLEPTSMGLATRNALSYHSYQRDLSYKVPMQVGSPMEQINMWFVRSSGLFDFRVAEGKSLVQIADEKPTPKLLVNGGYFIVNGNLTNTLTKFLTQADVGLPIGFAFDGTRVIDVLPIPLCYEGDFVVVMLTNTGDLSFVGYDEFLSMHEVEPVTVLYHFERYGKAALAQRKVKTQNGLPVTKDGLKYKKAFCIGPSLIRNGQVVFDLQKLLNEEMVLGGEYTKTNLNSKQIGRRFGTDPSGVKLDIRKIPKGTRYKASSTQQNYYKFRSEEGESNFIYGVRGSNNLQINAALCVSSANEVFWAFAEGRGYNAPGIDRAQFTWILSHFDIVEAISIDGGFSAQAVVIDSGKGKLLLQSPDALRVLGSAFEVK